MCAGKNDYDLRNECGEKDCEARDCEECEYGIALKEMWDEEDEEDV